MSDTVYTLLIVVPVLLVSISIHEMMHALASLWLGDDTARLEGRVSLNPFRHVDPLLTIALPIVLVLAHLPAFGAAKPVHVNMHKVKYGEFGGAIIGMVGPLTNLVIAVVAAGILHLLPGTTSGVIYDIIGYTIIINIGFFVFNSIPFPPLDGSRLLYAFAPRPLQELMESIERFGIMGFLIFMLLFYQFVEPLISNIIIKLTNGLI